MTSKPAPRTSYDGSVKYLRKVVTFEDAGKTVYVGTLPKGAEVFKELTAIRVTTAFNGGGADTIDVGYAQYVNSAGTTVAADPNAWATAVDVSSAGKTEFDEAAADFYANSDDDGVAVTATYTDASSDASAGSAVILIGYMSPNQGENDG